ncbi:TlpA family protein disulfide reductase [Fulvivirga ligni]|uniref:TlpA family protein disulfide reductase n=1 Tax=Fulvivirga ligni TaxID=2904246 RepID=UPI001F1D7B87|nr:thioredoxin family protein [Fulvivirga ligni]UII20858.1 peroxiredoxin family protein [Fulvivirga ligni]
MKGRYLMIASVCFIICFIPWEGSPAYGQEMHIGDVMPEIKLNRYMSSGEPIEIKSFKDKWIIIDFWSALCSGCMNSLAQMDVLQKAYPEQLQVILVNNKDRPDLTRQVFEKKGWELPSLLSTTQPLLDDMFPHHTYPHQVWINPEGIIQAITHETYALPQVVKEVLGGQPLAMKLKQDVAGDIQKPLLSMQDGRLPYYYSAITPYMDKVSSGILNDRGNLVYSNQSALHLLQAAYGLSSYTAMLHTRLEVSDNKRSQLVAPPQGSTMDSINAFFQWFRDNTYCYNLYMPENDLKDSKEIMKRDMNLFFEQHLDLAISWETRPTTCLVLKKTNEPVTPADLKGLNALKLENKPIRKIVTFLQVHLKDSGYLIIDETGMMDNVSLSFSGDLNDLDNIQKELQAQGFNLEKATRNLPMLVVTEKLNH